MAFVTERPPIFCLAYTWFVRGECCSLKHGQKLENFVFSKQNRAIWWILSGAFNKGDENKISVLHTGSTNPIVHYGWISLEGRDDIQAIITLVKHGRGYILQPPSINLHTWLSKRKYQAYTWGCANGGILSEGAMPGPLKGPGKFWNIDPIWGYILLILATNCAFWFSLYFQFDLTFLTPPLLWKTFWSPPLLVTQNFFGPPPFCPAPPPKYLWTLPKRLPSFSVPKITVIRHVKPILKLQ